MPESVTLCFHLSQLLQTCIAGAPHKIERRSRSALLTIGLRPRKSVLLRPPQFFVIFVCEIEFSQQSGSHFPDLIFQKCSEGEFFSIFSEVQIELSPQSCALFVGNFPGSRRGNVETKTPLRRPWKPLYPKKHRVSRPKVFSRVVPTRGRTVTLSNYLMMDV